MPKWISRALDYQDGQYGGYVKNLIAAPEVINDILIGLLQNIIFLFFIATHRDEYMIMTWDLQQMNCYCI